MTRRVLALQWVFIAALAASTVACGNSKSATGPSGLSSGGAIISGRVNVTGSAAATVAARFPMAVAVWAGVGPLASTTSSTVTVTIIGTNVSTTVDGGGSFTLTGVPPGTVTLRFQGRGADATLTISGVEADDTLQIEVTLNGGSARLESRSSSRGNGNGNGNNGNGNGNGNNGNGNNGVDVNGRIDSIDAGARTFRVEGSTVLVTSSTVIRHGNQTFRFSELRVGDHVQVKGNRNGSMVTASEIKVEKGGNGDDDDDDDGDLDRVEFRGTVSLLIGICPGLTMTVAGNRVVTNAATRFEDVTCGTVANGMVVEVEGIRRNDGSVLATEIDRVPDVQTEVRGTISLLIGTCPGLTFMVAGTTVVTNAATLFAPTPCNMVRNDMRVTVQGVRRSDGSVLASSVAAEGDTQTEVRGTVSLLIGTCPGLTFMVAGTTVVTNAATLFAPTPCNMVRNDMRVTVQGIRRSDGSVLASSVAAEADTQAVVRGTVSLLIGTCPGLTFTVAATSVVTNAATQFEDVTCGGLQNQMVVEVRGVRRNDGSVLATRVDCD